MEQYVHKKLDNNQDPFKDPITTKEVQPAIVVHCKAGKGRTGMMICALLVFLNLFETHKEAIRHYNVKRAKNTKALTIKS
jgi:phosphatidylinositol-3,4,5-trisphosphate 3-phosphatase/dual-specificity protein phosphatase PTEN